MAKQLKLKLSGSFETATPASKVKSSSFTQKNLEKTLFLSSSPPLPARKTAAPKQTKKVSAKDNFILESIFTSLISEYFPTRTDLLDYRLDWSNRRQKRTLASCNLRARKILVAQEMNHPDYQKYLPALIYHELCHAVLGYSVRSATGRSSWHGREFRALERKHPEISQLNLWIKEGGWKHAIRRHRGKISAAKRLKTLSRTQMPELAKLAKTYSIEARLIRQSNSIFSRFLKSFFKK